MKPLGKIRVLDLTNVLAGPFCCHQLAHLGAEVIKVEAAGRGDLARRLGGDPELNDRRMGVSFLAQNAGKKSITLNLKDSRGKDLLKRLVGGSHVLVENFRPGVMDRLDLGWPVLKEVNPKLVYAAISGFGQDGPWADRPAYDQIIQGASGIMSITGDDRSGPFRVGYPIADTIGGLTAAMAVCAALNNRDQGTFIDVSMLESVLATTGWVISNWLIAGVHPGAHGNDNITSSPSGTFQAADAPINIAANKEEQWRALARHLGREELTGDPQFATREARKRNRADLTEQIEKTLKTRPAREWVEELNRLGVPSGAVLDVETVLEHEVIASRGMLGKFENVPGVGRDIQVAGTGVKLDGEAPRVDDPPPILGQHNDEIYGSLGLDVEAVDALRAEGVI